jgi:probable blue pigment (indigoidine) exporter
VNERWRWVLITAIAPVAWGSTYYVTRHFLPADAPLWGSALRAFPAGIVLMLLARRMPRGAWWWRSAVLAVLNVGAFLLLIYIAASLLPSSVAASVMAASPLVLAVLAWLIVGVRPSPRVILGAVVGITGVLLIVGTSVHGVDPWGVAASVAALLMSSTGFVLAQRWRDGTPVLASTAWQLVGGGLVLVVAAIVVEGPPPVLSPSGVAAVAYVSLVATALAYVCWFAGLARLTAGAVGIVGLLNPVTGVVLGVVLAGERLGVAQLAGIAMVLGAVVLGQTRRKPQAPLVTSI